MDLLFFVFPVLFIWAVVSLIIGKSVGKNRKAPSSGVSVRETPKQISRPSNAGEGHVPTIGPNVKSRLEQLETLKKAGLVDQEEYIAKRQKILKSM